jgi:mannose-6-phosphate isomerase-like protein (cupin superfamily)
MEPRPAFSAGDIGQKVNLIDKLALFDDHFNPRVVGQVNDTAVKLVKFQGEFVWHSHEHEDELFFVVGGSFEMHFRDKIVTVNTGEFLIVPHGVEHKPVAEREVSIMLIEPATTLNTGDAAPSDLTRTTLETI